VRCHWFRLQLSSTNGWPDWFDAIPADVAERAFRDAEAEAASRQALDARRQTPAGPGQPPRMPASSNYYRA
jgi:hypothetical protein